VRVKQTQGSRGSLKWIQRLVENHPDILNEKLRRMGALEAGRRLEWLSPLRNDDWAEYRDAQFLRRIGAGHLARELKSFWPRRGPQWDALAQDGSGRVFLVEAKAHAAELASSCQAGAVSKEHVLRALDATKVAFGVPSNSDWLSGYYQYANRLAHLHFLRHHGVEAFLMFLYFVGDAEMKGPSLEDEWKPSIRNAHTHLGLPTSEQGVLTVFQDVRSL
jgi:hypothetical protein